MEAEVVGNDSAGTSWAFAATAAGTEDSVMTNEPICDMPTEIIPTGTDSQPSRSRIDYSSDLRKELSFDVLESLGGSSADDAKSIQQSLLDMATERADMDFIAELSSLGLPLGNNDSNAADTALPPSEDPIVEPHYGTESTGAPTTADMSFTGDDSSLSLPGPSTVHSPPSLPNNEVPGEVSLESLMNSTSSAAGALMENTNTALSPTHFTSGSDAVPSISDTFYALSSGLSFVSPGEDNSRVVDAPADLQPSPAPKELTESGFAGPSDSETDVFSHTPLEPLSSSAISFLASDGDPAIVEAYDGSSNSFPSPEPALVSDAAPVHSVQFVLPRSYPPAISQPTDTAISAEPPTLAFSPAPLTSGDHGADSPQATVDLPLVGVPSFTPCEMDLPEASVDSLQAFPSGLETLLPAPAHLSSSNSPMPAENPPFESTSLPSAFAAPAEDYGLSSSAVLTPPSNGNTPLSDFSPAVNSLPITTGLSPAVNKPDDLDSTTSPPPFVPPAVNTSSPGVNPSSLTTSLLPTKVPPLSDSVSSPPLTARFWDVPKPLSPRISLSVYFDGSRSSFRGRKTNRKKRPSDAGGDAKDIKGKGLSDIENLDEVYELESMLEAQKRMVKWQIDEIQRIATLQFQLTGSNPLSEEAMWEVLGVKGGGKKLGDALPPEALKCLQDIFAIKDTLTKKEARDISFTTGASLTQVREYFAAQRSLVRRLVQQAHDEAGRLGIKNASEQSQQIVVLNSISEIDKDLGFDKLSGAESIEKFVEAMRAEKGFAGQVQLLQVILHTDSSALTLRRFLEKGGLKMLGGWLVEAASEQQTSVISHLLKVLDHLPMSNAVSHQMQPLVQNVNKLRFHEASAVAGQAKSLLTKWVKLLSPKPKGKPVSSPGSKPLAGSTTPSGGLKRNRESAAAQTVPGARKKKVRAEEVSEQETKTSPAAVVTDSASLNGVRPAASEQTTSGPAAVSVPPPAAKQRWSSTLQPSESAVAAVSVSRKRLASKSFGDPSKDRRKVLLVEENHLGKSPNSKPATIAKTSRPLSTDDIYKAKKLERLMQEPILKSRRRPVAGSQEQSVAQDTAPNSDGRRGLSSPAVVQPSDLGAVKRETSSSSPGSWRGGSLTGKSSQEQPTATRSRLPMREPENRDVKMSIAPASSEALLQTTITPTSPHKQSHPGFFTGHASEEVAYKRDSSLNSAAPMETDPPPSSFLGRSGQEQSGNSHYGGYSQEPLAGAGSLRVDAAALNAIAPKDQSHSLNSSQSFFSESNGSTPIVKSTSAAVEGIRMPPVSSEPSEARLKELSGLSVLRGVMNLVDKSAMDVTGIKDQLGNEQELGRGNGIKPSPREASLSGFYAALRASMVRWRVPPEYHPDSQWNVAAGEDSKEREIQSGRVKREDEAYYPELSAVPDDPKDPWEEEPNYDDSLTLEIFVDSGQRKVFTEVNSPSDTFKPTVMNVVQYGPEATPIGADVLGDTMLNSAPNSNHGQQFAPQSLSKGPPTVNGRDQAFQQLSGGGGGGGGAHDPDLLALLLRNPELVSQLTLGHAFNPSAMANQPGVFNQPMDSLKQQLSSGGNNGAAGLSNPAAGDLGQERLITSNNSKALGIPLQPGRSVSSVDQTPPETMRVQDSIQMMPPPGMGQQQNMGFVHSQGGVVDNRYLSPQMPSSVVARNNIQDPSGWEQQRLPPPPPLPPPVPPMQQPPVINQVLQHQPLPNQHNKLQPSWPEPQDWSGMGRPPLNPPPQTRPGPEQQQLHTRQPLINHNMRLPNYGGLVGVPQHEGPPEPAVVSQPDVHHSQRPWLNGSHIRPPAHDNAAVIHSNQQDPGASRNNRWQPRPPVRPPDQHVPVRPPPDQYSRPGNRDFTDFNNISRQTSVVDDRSGWVPNERARPILPQFQQGAFPLPPPPPYPAQLWQGQDQGPNGRLVQQGGGGQVNPFSHGRNPRQQQSQQQQMWPNNNVGPGSRQAWRGQQ